MANKKKKADKARFTLPIETWVATESVISTVKQQIANVQKCDDYINQTDIQARAKATIDSGDTLAKTLTDLGAAKLLVSKLEGQRDQQLVTLQANHTALETSVNVVCKGQVALIKAYGGTPATRTVLPATTEPPVNTAVTTTSTPGNIAAKCRADRSAICYLFQAGSDPANPDAWPKPEISNSCKYVFTGLPVGQKVYVRIAIIRRRGGQSQWSGLLEATVR